jgi:hypothetical protein
MVNQETEAKTPPSVKKEGMVEAKSKFVYIGPDYPTCILRGGETYDPKTMSDEHIKSLFTARTWAKEWFKEV